MLIDPPVMAVSYNPGFLMKPEKTWRNGLSVSALKNIIKLLPMSRIFKLTNILAKQLNRI